MIQTNVITEMPIDPVESQDVLTDAKAGDHESFKALCAPLGNRLLRQAFVLCRDESQSQDLAQETLVEAWKSLRRFNGRCQFFTWLCSILLNRHRSALRRAKWRSFVSPFSIKEEERMRTTLLDLNPTPSRASELEERSVTILESLDQLPSRQREVVYLRFYTGESLAGIAGVMGCSVGTVKSRLFHALENLRRMRAITKDLL